MVKALPVRAGATVRGAVLASLQVLKILVLKDVRGGADQAEPDAFGAAITGRERVAFQHDHFVSGAVGAVVDNLINSAFDYRLSGAEHVAVTLRSGQSMA